MEVSYMNQGTVKLFNGDKGFGFISNDIEINWILSYSFLFPIKNVIKFYQNYPLFVRHCHRRTAVWIQPYRRFSLPKSRFLRLFCLFFSSIMLFWAFRPFMFAVYNAILLCYGLNLCILFVRCSLVAKSTF